MTAREALHALIDQLPDEQVDLAHLCLEELRDAAGTDGPPLDDDTLAALDRGLADIAQGRTKVSGEDEQGTCS